jgi:SAM-dependent methyltransferase
MNSNTTYGQFLATYYDDFYCSKKDYSKEALSVVEVFKKHGLLSSDRIIDIGCGTGEHARYIATQGYQVKGIDISPHMIQSALSKVSPSLPLSFACQSILEEREAYNFACSLFNVINCLPDKNALFEFMQGASRVLRKGGIFICEAWRAEATLANPPQCIRDEVTVRGKTVNRTVSPLLDTGSRVCILNYSYEMDARQESVRHSIKLFTEVEVEEASHRASLSLLSKFSSLQQTKPEPSSRQVVYIFKKV